MAKNIINYNDMAYTWIPFYKELAQKLLRFRNDRTPLVNWIYDNLQGYINHLKDAPDGRRVPDVDPFTVFAIFNRGITDDKRIDICEKFKRFLDVSASVPQDFDAIPVMNAKQSNFMAFADRREEGDLERLWNVFELAVLDKKVEPEIVRVAPLAREIAPPPPEAVLELKVEPIILKLASLAACIAPPVPEVAEFELNWQFSKTIFLQLEPI